MNGLLTVPMRKIFKFNTEIFVQFLFWFILTFFRIDRCQRFTLQSSTCESIIHCTFIPTTVNIWCLNVYRVQLLLTTHLMMLLWCTIHSFNTARMCLSLVQVALGLFPATALLRLRSATKSKWRKLNANISIWPTVMGKYYNFSRPLPNFSVKMCCHSTTLPRPR